LSRIHRQDVREGIDKVIFRFRITLQDAVSYNETNICAYGNKLTGGMGCWKPILWQKHHEGHSRSQQRPGIDRGTGFRTEPGSDPASGPAGATERECTRHRETSGNLPHSERYSPHTKVVKGLVQQSPSPPSPGRGRVEAPRIRFPRREWRPAVASSLGENNCQPRYPRTPSLPRTQPVRHFP